MMYQSLILNYCPIFSIELHMASTAYTLHEQKGVKPQRLRANPKTFSKIKIKYFEDLIFLVYNKSFQLTLQQMNVFLYQKALNNSFASLNPINTDPCNETAAYWLMIVVC